MPQSQAYTKEFFQRRQLGAESSARVIVPIVVELVAPHSVVDVGCGTGEFLEVFMQNGVTNVLGVDGGYVKKEDLVIAEEKFIARDLEKPLGLNRKFDLAICLEVAEHLIPGVAKAFIQSLTSLSDIVLFSAAIPGQGGTNHINEQWITYWLERFEKEGFIPVDAIRKRVWQDDRVEPWYKQNTIIVCKEEVLEKNKKLAQESELTSPEILSIVHPDIFDYYVNKNGGGV